MTTRQTNYAPETVERYRDALSKKHFAVLTAAPACGGNYAAMAAALDLKIGTVKSQMNRARKALALLIEKDGMQK